MRLTTNGTPFIGRAKQAHGHIAEAAHYDIDNDKQTHEANVRTAGVKMRGNMTTAEAMASRLNNQQLKHTQFEKVEDLVNWMGMMQAHGQRIG